jgi:signal transduction histidine kinase/FixJ family two-component response regulator
MIAGLSPDQEALFASLLKLFSVVMVIDPEFRIIYASDTLKKHMPALEEEMGLLDAFELSRPGSVNSYQAAQSHLGSLFLMIARDNSFAVRGQIVQQFTGDQGHLVFCGAPWLFWMASKRIDVKLGLKDFASQDAQLDQMFYISTEKRMVADLEALNSELKLAKEEVEAVQEARNAFFTRMSHEMRTPLNGVVSALALMRDLHLAGKAADLLNLASKASENLMQVINYVLDVSKLETSHDQAEEIEFDLPELIGSVSDVVRARAIEKGLALENRIDGRLSAVYKGDAPRLRQSLLNLLMNAIKFTRQGGISIAAEPAREEGQSIRIEVTDTGTGIDKTLQAHVFEPFVTLESGAQKGTGLGLDIARRNVESMGGRIGVSSALGVGSTFWVELPLEASQVEPAPVKPIESRSADAATFDGRVLLVDDNETNLMLGAMILEGLGAKVLQASSGEQAVEMAGREDFDLVLMDISMPGIDGYEATRQIRAFKSASELPVVALTAFASSVERERSEAAGMNAYLTKPIERDQLVSALASYLGAGVADGPEISAAVQPRSQVNRAVLDDLVGQIGSDNLGVVIGKFLSEAARRWNALASASNDSDLAREAHTLASTCRSFGLPDVADKLNCIESHAKADGIGGEPPCVNEVGSQLQAGLRELEQVVARLQAG